MSHLIQEYAKSLGVKIGKPFLIDHFYPINAEKYITIHCDNKIDSKYYEYFPQVLNLLSPILKQNGYKIFQVGSINDPELKNVDGNLLNLNFKQSSYVLKNSSLHIGIDSLPVHIASAYDVPIVVLYSHVFPLNANPFWSSPDKVEILESKRDVVPKPSFSYQELPKTIRTIDPEDIVNAALKLLKIPKIINFKTLFIGQYFHIPSVEVVPNFKANIEDQNGKLLIIRNDLVETLNLDSLNFWVSKNKSIIITNQEIPFNFLRNNFQNIEKIIFKIDKYTPNKEYLIALKRSKISFILLTQDKENLPKIRNDFFDFQVELDKSIHNIEKLPTVNNESLFFSNKILISNGKLYSSEAHLKNEKTLDSGPQKSYDDPIFWKDIDYFYFYENGESTTEPTGQQT